MPKSESSTQTSNRLFNLQACNEPWMRKPKSPIWLLSSSAVLLGCCTAMSAMAATFEPGEYEDLLSVAQVRGFVPVMVVVDNVPLASMIKGLPSVNAAMARKANVLRQELGKELLDVGYWSNGIGQVGLNVTPAGLALLRNSATAIRVMRDVTAPYRVTINDSDGSLQAIESALNREGRIDVEVVFNLDAVDYEIEANGKTRFRALPGLKDDLSAALREMTGQGFARGFRNLDARALDDAAPSPKIRVNIDWPTFVGMREHKGIRAIRPVAYQDRRSAIWDADALTHASREGSAEVSINLRGGELYSPKSGYMTGKAWSIQEAAHTRALREILAAAGASRSVQESVSGVAVGGLSLRLPAHVLERLFELRDPRIFAVVLNRPLASAALSTAMKTINAQLAWANGWHGNGQNIVVMDTGVRRTHEMFKNAAGDGRVTFEACFGSNVSPYVSVCPAQNSGGDSPLGSAGAGDPYTSPACGGPGNACSHGTLVASIAAGRSSLAVGGGKLQGVAIGANIIPVQIFSWRPGTIDAKVFGADVNQALLAVLSATSPGGLNPYVVNMSFGTFDGHASDCVPPYPASDLYDPNVPAAVSSLISRGVPVVAAAGNFGPKHTLSWPACVPLVTKVSGVQNALDSRLMDTKWNYGDPGTPTMPVFTGSIFLAPAGDSSGATNVQGADRTSNTAVTQSNGTSFAAPQVSGIYAGLKAANPYISVASATGWIAANGVTVTALLPPANVRSWKMIRIQ